MISISEAEKREISRGNTLILQEVLSRTLEEAKERLITEKVEVLYWQVRAQISKEILSWININR